MLAWYFRLTKKYAGYIINLIIIFGEIFMYDILLRDGLSIDLLEDLSYKSQLGINLKKNLHYFDKDALLDEVSNVQKWYYQKEYLHDLALDYRIKSLQSAMMKYNRYYPDHQTRKVFDDLLGLRSLCDSYDGICELENNPCFRIADMSQGKANDDGYRGVHIYYQKDNFCYPIEIQYNTYFDRQFNNWLHKYLYKKDYSRFAGCELREMYDNGKIKTESEFEEAMNNVLFNS